MDTLCMEIWKSVLSYIQTDELFPVRHVCRDWYNLVNLSLPPRPKPTYKSITSESLLDYYDISTPVSSRFIERIIEEVDNYDFYDQYLSHMHIYKTVCRALVDDYRYRTIHGLTSVKLMERYAYKYASLIPDTIPLTALEHLGTSIKDDRLIPAYASLMSPTLINKAMFYSNMPLLKTLCHNYTDIDYSNRSAYMYIHCSYEVIDFMVTNGYISCPISNYYSEVALTYIADNFNNMKQHLNNNYYRIFNSRHMTPELATRFINLIGHADIPTDLACYPEIAHIMEPYLSDTTKIKYYKSGILTPKKVFPMTLNSYVIIDVLEHYGTIYTFKPIPLLIATQHEIKKKQPAIERFLDNPTKFIKKYSTLKNGWVGTISHPDIYKYIVVQTWNYEYDYIGPITSDLHKLAFHPNIGNPLIGHQPLSEFVMPNRKLTIYEKKSLLKLRRVDIIVKYDIRFDVSHIYEYLKYNLDEVGLPLYQYFEYGDITVPKYDITKVPLSVLDRIKTNANNRRCQRYSQCKYTFDERMLLAIGDNDVSISSKQVLWHKVEKETIPILVKHDCYPSLVTDKIKLINTLNAAASDSSLTDNIKEIMYNTLMDHHYIILKCNRNLYEISKYYINRKLRKCIENIIYK